MGRGEWIQPPHPLALLGFVPFKELAQVQGDPLQNGSNPFSTLKPPSPPPSHPLVTEWAFLEWLHRPGWGRIGLPVRYFGMVGSNLDK